MSTTRSTTRSATRRTAAVVVGLAAAAGLVCGGGTAAADPPSLNVDPCAQLLARATQWPGESSDGSLRFSDAYELHLLRQPACTPGT